MRLFAAIVCIASLQVTLLRGVDYKSEVLPIMKERCWDCHSNDKEVKGNLALDDFDEVRDYQVGKYNIIRPGNPEESNFLERLTMDSSHTDFMPRKAERIPQKEIDLIEDWIRKGAVIDAKNPSEDEQEWVQKMGAAPAGESALAEPTAFETWTSSDGKEIQARFLEMKNGMIGLLLENGKRADVPESRLDDASQARARELAVPKGS
jgi:hypothetical protein